ncbi:MaoC family dehydratase [Devosia sp. MC1541]|uniref:MaoC family dehydratase n=1 Tax=Devosia sp. MC1541 TaxID=2725264 RepID=UPI00145D65B8|nr:MaoC family dehydratase [Devosia sp. MC1541]
MTRWFEEINLNEDFPMGSHTFTQDEIVRFASLYDPQYFHTDAEEAKHSHFGGIIASGWHTASVGQRLMVDALFAEEKRLIDAGQSPGVSGPSPGISSMQYTTPVRPGDTITYSMYVKSKRVSNSLPGWGVLITHVSSTNQNGEAVYSAELVSFSKLRDYKMPLKLKLLLGLTKVPLLKSLIKRGS